MVLNICAIGDATCWMTAVYEYLANDELSNISKEVTTERRSACSYVLVEDKLNHRGFSITLLKCVEEEKIPYVLCEIHEYINA